METIVDLPPEHLTNQDIQPTKRKKTKSAEETAEPQKSSGKLMTKMAQILSEISRVPKSGYNAHHKYHYVTEADLADHIRPLLAKHGIAIIFSMENVIDIGNDVTQDECVITVGDESESFQARVFGRGKDPQDKGIYKATTGAMKYWLFKTFLVSTGDDPEVESKPDPQTQKLNSDWNQWQEWKAAMDKISSLDVFNEFVAKTASNFSVNSYANDIRKYVAERRAKFQSQTSN